MIKATEAKIISWSVTLDQSIIDRILKKLVKVIMLLI